MKQISDNTFDQCLKTSKLVVVDFNAQWCGPCKVLGQVIEKIKEEYKNKVEFLSCDVDECTELVERFVIKSVPTLIAFKYGHDVWRTGAFLGETALKAKLDELI